MGVKSEYPWPEPGLWAWLRFEVFSVDTTGQIQARSPMWEWSLWA
jgi:hypothetical protein